MTWRELYNRIRDCSCPRHAWYMDGLPGREAEGVVSRIAASARVALSFSVWERTEVEPVGALIVDRATEIRVRWGAWGVAVVSCEEVFRQAVREGWARQREEDREPPPEPAWKVRARARRERTYARG